MNDRTLGVAASPGRVPGGVFAGRTVAWRAVVRVLRSPVVAFEDVMTSVFPGDCRVCGGPLSFAVGRQTVCAECLIAVKAQRGLLCGCCGEAMGMESERFARSLRSEGVRCSECRLAPPEFERAMAYGVYEGELREMTHLLKYEGMRSLAAVLGGRLAEVIEGLGLREAMMVAVPLFPAKERARGYNQAVLLGDAAARVLRGRVRLEAAHGCLRRVRDTESQFALSPKGRRVNLRGAFAAREVERLAGRPVLLVDDIFTTGATARECSRVLRRAGAAKVYVATLARAQKEQVALWDGRGEMEAAHGFGWTMDETTMGRTA